MGSNACGFFFLRISLPSIVFLSAISTPSPLILTLAKHCDAYDAGANIIQRIAMRRRRGEQDSKEHNNQITGCGARELGEGEENGRGWRGMWR